MALRRLAPFTLLALLAGCSSIQETISDWTSSDRAADALPAKLEAFQARASFVERWHQSVGESRGNSLTPAKLGDAVYATSARGEVRRLDAATGKPVWQAAAGFDVSAGVGVGDGLIVVGGDKGQVAAFGEDGKLRWKARVSSSVISAPQIADGVVVVRAGDGKIEGLEVASGKSLWNYQRATPTLIVHGHAGVAIQRNALYAGFAGGKLVALNLKTGAVLWEATVSQPRGNTELERISDVTSTPVVDDEQVCAVSFQGRLACFEIAQGGLMWSRDISSDQGMALLRKFIYLTDATGVVYALDKGNGSTLWKNDQLQHRRLPSPTPRGDHVVVGDMEGYLHALGREDGALVARTKTDGSPIQVAPTPIEGGGFLVQTDSGGLYSYTLQ